MIHPDITAALARDRQTRLLAEAAQPARAKEARRPALEAAMQPAICAFCGEDRQAEVDAPLCDDCGAFLDALRREAYEGDPDIEVMRTSTPSGTTTGTASPFTAMQGSPPP
jgi:hypothetical protein